MPERSTNKDANAEEPPVEVWPPLGFSTYYTVTEQMEGQPEISYHFVLPGSFAQVDLATPIRAQFSTVDYTWTMLVKKLREQCDGSDDRRKRLAQVLDWSEEHRIKRRRDNVVHADWWDFAGCGVRRSRFARGKNGATILASLIDLEEDARLLFEYARRLDELLGNDWIIGRLPGPFRLREGAAAASLPSPE
jgi:hypothetical protein